MPISDCRMTLPLRLALLIVAAAGAAGCSSLPWDSSPQTTATASSRAPTFRERMSDLFLGPSSDAPLVQTAAASQRDPSDECPGVDIRAGASTLRIMTPGTDPSATSLRYQVTVARTARECAIRAGTMNIKVGVQGRIILGPEGGPGRVEVPVRYALVREGVEPKTIWTQIYKVPVEIPTGQQNVTFMHLEEGMSFPLPSRNELAAYVVYVGFDQMTPAERLSKKTKARRSR